MHTIHIRPLGFVFATKNNAVEVFGLDAKNAPRCKNCMVDIYVLFSHNLVYNLILVQSIQIIDIRHQNPHRR